MTYNPDIHHRRSIRLQHYDYNQPGSYFVTICTHEKKWLFGEIVNNEMLLNDVGQIVQSIWNTLPQRFPGIELDVYVIMPNHFHGIITNIEASCDAQFIASNNPLSSHLSTFGQIIRTFKSATTRQIRKTVMPNFAWQSTYYEHIIRSDNDVDRIRQYISNNPASWTEDSLNIKEGSLT